MEKVMWIFNLLQQNKLTLYVYFPQGTFKKCGCAWNFGIYQAYGYAFKNIYCVELKVWEGIV